MSNGKVMIIHLIVGLIEKILLHEMSCFSESYTHIKIKMKVELNLCNYARKSDLKERNRCRYIKIY